MAPTPSTRASVRGSLEDLEWTALVGLGRWHGWGKGELLLRAGQPADSAIVLLDGLVKIHKLSGEGTEVVLALSGPGDLLGEVSAIPGAQRSADVTALEAVEGLIVAAPALRAFLRDNPRATLSLLELAIVRLSEGNTRRMEFATSESLGRVASRLVELAERFGEPGDHGTVDVGLPITQEELASWSASSRESTARALRTLRQLGLIETSRRRLRVRDLDGLRVHEARL